MTRKTFVNNHNNKQNSYKKNINIIPYFKLIILFIWILPFGGTLTK